MLVACNPMEEINKELDAKAPTYVQSISDVLTNADYDAMGGNVAKYHAFSESDPAADYVPAFLKSKYPGLTSGSADKVTYNFKNSYPDLSAFTGAQKYTLTEADYKSVSETVGAVQYFSPGNPADNSIPSILAASITDAANGDHYIVSYQYSAIDPNPNDLKRSTLLEKTFNTDLAPFTEISVTGDQVWEATSYGAKMNGYSGGAVANEDWLISPAINLDGYKDGILNFTQIINYLHDQWDQITVAVSTDYSGTGDPNAATWTALTIPNLPSGSSWSSVASGDVDLSAYDGQTIYIAFKYLSSDSNASTWEIPDFSLSAVGAPVVQTTTVEVFYTKSSYGWAKSTDAYYVKADDYNAMGGSLAKYHDFSSSDNPDNYLPQMLQLKFPYAQEGTTIAVVYKYYSSGLKTYGDQYSVVNGMWTKYDPVEIKTDQFILGSSNEWVFDPTVSFTMASSDYQIVVDWVKTNKGDSYVDSYGTQDFYYGAGSYYSNYDLRDGKWDTSVFSTWQDAVAESIAKVLLPAKFPNAVAQVSGIDVMYKVTFATYGGSAGVYTWTFQCTKSGPNPEFTYIEQ